MAPRSCASGPIARCICALRSVPEIGAARGRAGSRRLAPRPPVGHRPATPPGSSVLRSHRAPDSLGRRMSILVRAGAPNRLAGEESPYLLQHQTNPVDWYPWGDEAIERARSENKPIFLSVGYSSCHWCHVMEHESFEDEEVAAYLNEHFVSVKVDREERPDVDRTYMEFVQAMTGSGGWPMTVFLTPDLEPIVGGTYFPKQDAYGRPGFLTLIRRIADLWSERGDEIRGSARNVMRQLEEVAARAARGGKGAVSRAEAHEMLATCAGVLAGRFDGDHGGFGGAPKFPRPAELTALMEHAWRAKQGGDEAAAAPFLGMTHATLTAMSRGGICDQVGGGMHRYSVDELWHVPHFEKMLYDNAQVARACVDYVALTGDASLDRFVRSTLDYLLRGMRHAEKGAFTSAEDADSPAESGGRVKEGAFYVWGRGEVEEALGGVEGGGGGGGGGVVEEFCRMFDVRPSGNCDRSARSDPHGEFAGKNVLYVARPGEGASGGVSEGIERALRRLHEVRSQRPRPRRDDKVIVAWNGMAISAMARAAGVLSPSPAQFPATTHDPHRYLQAAEEAACFIQSHLYDKDSKMLARSYRTRKAGRGFADDYAQMVGGLLDMYEVSGSLSWLEWASDLQSSMDAHFWDDESGGYFHNHADDPHVRVRFKEDTDNAEPAASSIAALNISRLSHLFPDMGYQEKAQRCVDAFAEVLRESPLSMPTMAAAAAVVATSPEQQQVILAKHPGCDDAAHAALLREVTRTYRTGRSRTIVHIDLSKPGDVAFWEKHNPAALAVARGSEGPSRAPAGAGAVAYVCERFTCREPTSDPVRLRELLEGGMGGPGEVRAFDVGMLRRGAGKRE